MGPILLPNLRERPRLLVLLIGFAGVIWFVMLLRSHHRKTLAAAGRWRDRPRTSDHDFLSSCEIPEEPLPVEVALAVRKAIAELGTVSSETIRPVDTFAHDLAQLPFWDSLDWMDLVLGIEEKFDGKVLVTESCIDDAVKLAGGRSSQLKVKHVVRAMALSAAYRPKATLLDDEL